MLNYSSGKAIKKSRTLCQNKINKKNQENQKNQLKSQEKIKN